MFRRPRFPLILGLCLSISLAQAANEVRNWQTVRGQTHSGSYVKTEGENVLIRKKNSKDIITIPKEELLPPDVAYLEQLEKGTPATKPASGGKSEPAKNTTTPGGNTDPAPGLIPSEGGGEDEVPGEPAKGRLYPRTKEEIRNGLREIFRREKPKDLNREVHDAINRLNAFRFLSGLYDKVGSEPHMNEGAQDASEECAKEGKISHGLGHSTDKCNLSMGHHDMAGTVNGYIDDGGDNNREKRGHRWWCLNPAMKNAGFGREGVFSAMWCMDGSGTKSREPWSYPGRGLYPLDYVLGTAWSFYYTADLPSDTTVRIWKLTSRPEQAIHFGADPKGREIKVGFTHVWANAINFEPDSSIKGKRGIYWVRIQGRGVREQFLTELF